MNPEKARSSAGQPASILVVDDTAANLQVLAGMLKDRGYKVRPVPSGKLALLAARRDPPDLILLDINMPEMNGYEVCEHLKADEALKGIPVIFISALTEPLDKVKAFAEVNFVVRRGGDGGMQVIREKIPDIPAELKQVIEEQQK